MYLILLKILVMKYSTKCAVTGNGNTLNKSRWLKPSSKQMIIRCPSMIVKRYISLCNQI